MSGYNIKAISNVYELNLKDMQQHKLVISQVFSCPKAIHNYKRETQTYKNKTRKCNNVFYELLFGLMMEQREQM
jgi:VanZ family protein